MLRLRPRATGSKDVVEDGKQPSPAVGSDCELMKKSIRPQHRLLTQVVRFFFVTREIQRGREQNVEMGQGFLFEESSLFGISRGHSDPAFTHPVLTHNRAKKFPSA